MMYTNVLFDLALLYTIYCCFLITIWTILTVANISKQKKKSWFFRTITELNCHATIRALHTLRTFSTLELCKYRMTNFHRSISTNPLTPLRSIVVNVLRCLAEREKCASKLHCCHALAVPCCTCIQSESTHTHEKYFVPVISVQLLSFIRPDPNVPRSHITSRYRCLTDAINLPSGSVAIALMLR